MEPVTTEIASDAEESQPRRKGLFLKLIFAVGILVSLVAVGTSLLVVKLNEPPDNFPINQPVSVESGASIRAIANDLEELGIIQSEALLYYQLIFFHDPTSIKASTYVFEEPLTSNEIATRLTEGDFDTDLISFTHIEGERAELLAERAGEVLPNLDVQQFINSAEPYEGKLFPETYLVPPEFNHEDLLSLLLQTYEEKIDPLRDLIELSELKEDEVIILASIIEREANSPESMRLVSSVLQNRLAIDMPLQADASIEYILNKPLAELTPADLEIESPYNTYLNLGLPPTAIGNPGLDSIMAVLEPTESEYFYYITGNDGQFYFAETYNEHLRNIDRHLR
jgi:UPF0755 protein